MSDSVVHWDAIETASWILAVPCFTVERQGEREGESGPPERGRERVDRQREKERETQQPSAGLEIEREKERWQCAPLFSRLLPCTHRVSIYICCVLVEKNRSTIVWTFFVCVSVSLPAIFLRKPAGIAAKLLSCVVAAAAPTERSTLGVMEFYLRTVWSTNVPELLIRCSHCDHLMDSNLW